MKCEIKIDQLIDVIEGNRVYMGCLYIYNKIDNLTIEEIDEIGLLFCFFFCFFGLLFFCIPSLFVCAMVLKQNKNITQKE